MYDITCTSHHMYDMFHRYHTNLLNLAQLEGSLMKGAYHQTYRQRFAHFRANVPRHSLHPPLLSPRPIGHGRFSANGSCMSHHVAVCCSVLLQYVAVYCCSVLQCEWVLYESGFVAVWCCSVLQCEWVLYESSCCSVLQCVVAVCCSILLQCVAVRMGPV